MKKFAILSLAVVAAFVASGCREHMPHAFTWPAGGDIVPTHPKPPEGGYYSNWDPYAATIEITPVRDVNPVQTQHVFIATVKDKNGKPLPNRRVEWLIAEGSVGMFVEVDESGWRASRGYKMTNTFAVTHTNNGPHVLTRGTPDTKDDVRLTKGQTWAVITSPTEGTTHVAAYAPGIHDWTKHKVFAVKHWYDATWKFPPAATNPIGTPHKFITAVAKYSDGTPLPNHIVRYQVVKGPDAVFAENGKKIIDVRTDAKGLGTATLKQVKAVEGTNTIAIDVIRPADTQCCKPAVHLASGKTTKTWIGPKIAIQKTAPAQAVVGQQFRYNIVVSNPGRVAATNTVVTDELLDGIQYVSSNPRAKIAGQKLTWTLGTVKPGQKVGLTIDVKATKTGKFNNCAIVTADHGLKAEDCALTVVGAAALSLVKTGPAEVIQCDPITYRLTVKNTGSAPAQNVQIVDNLPAGMLWQQKHQVIRSRIGTLMPGQAKTVDFTVQAMKTGTFTNTATATADGGLTAKASAQTVVRIPSLVITKSGPGMRYVGRNMTYNITVSNKGDAVAKGTTLVDTLPAGVTFVSATAGGQASGGKVTWSLGDLKPGASAKVALTVKATTKGVMKNTATATAYCTKATASAQTTVKGIAAILLECVDIEDPIEVGSSTTYIITVTNQGSAQGTNIVITCELPKELQYVSATGPAKAAVAGKVITFAPAPSLAPKQQITYKVTAKGVGTGDVRFKVQLKSDQMTSPSMETESTNVYK